VGEGQRPKQNAFKEALVGRGEKKGDKRPAGLHKILYKAGRIGRRKKSKKVEKTEKRPRTRCLRVKEETGTRAKGGEGDENSLKRDASCRPLRGSIDGV